MTRRSEELRNRQDEPQIELLVCVLCAGSSRESDERGVESNAALFVPIGF
jgi:hypothetical protein